jgi:hypothetical protein
MLKYQQCVIGKDTEVFYYIVLGKKEEYVSYREKRGAPSYGYSV